MLNPVDKNAIIFPAGPNVQPRNKITVENVRHVFEQLEPKDAHRFERDLQIYGDTGERSAFLLGILAIAAGDIRECSASLSDFSVSQIVN
jgi:hypothetical protein